MQSGLLAGPRPILALMALLLPLAGCPEKQQPAAPDLTRAQPRPRPRPRPVDPAIADLPALDPGVADDRSRWPRPPAAAPTQVAVRRIVVGFAGGTGSQAKRSKEQAQRRARQLALLARKKGADFVALARRYSEVPPGQRGVEQVVSPGELPRALDRVAFGMGVGQVSDPVPGQTGYEVLMRVEPEEYSSAHILIQYKGAKGAPPALTRSKEEARALAEKVRALAVKPDAQFAVLAARNSDSPSRNRGGVIRPVAPGQMPAEYTNYINAVRQLGEGEISEVVETPFGFHVIKRLKLVKIRASHILIAFKGSEGEGKEERNRREAEVLARKLQQEASASGADFAQLARKHSDHLESAEKGGDLGTFARGMMPSRFEQIAFSLKVGQVSDLVETPLGFHIILRTE